MAKGRDNRGREDKKKKKKPKKEQVIAPAAINFQHHSVPTPPVEKSQD
jgi:hypothetical protein